MHDKNQTLFIKPAWKMILSNKAILAVLWELFPGHPYLLPAYFESDRLTNYVRKPIPSREGANIDMVMGEELICRTGGEYGASRLLILDRLRRTLELPKRSDLGFGMRPGIGYIKPFDINA